MLKIDLHGSCTTNHPGLGNLESCCSEALEEDFLVVSCIVRIKGVFGRNKARSADRSHLAESVAGVEKVKGWEALQQGSWSSTVGHHVLGLEVEAGLGTLAASAELGQNSAGSWLVASDLEEANISMVASLDVVGIGNARCDIHDVALDAVTYSRVGGARCASDSSGGDSDNCLSEVSRLVLVSAGFVSNGTVVGSSIGGGGSVVVVVAGAEFGVVAAVSAVVEVSGVEAGSVVSKAVGRVSEGEGSCVISSVDDFLLRLGEGNGSGKKLHNWQRFCVEVV